MSDIIYDEVPEYKTGMWKTYARHNDTEISGFFGKYRFLSNFYDAEVKFGGVTYPSSEAAYQASKIKPEYREPYYTCSAKDSKKMNRDDKKLPDKLLYTAAEFDSIKRRIMKRIVFDKFYRHEHLKEMLFETGNLYLEEANQWGDVFWGKDHKLGGENELGKVLMEIRTILRENEL